MTDFTYDIETYPNCFTCCIEQIETGECWMFEISDFRDDSQQLLAFLEWMRSAAARMVGFNNLGFDYPVIHTALKMGRPTAKALYDKAMAIINSQDNDDRWVHQVKESDRWIQQVDLYKIHHFDNRNRYTSLKALEFNMRLNNIEDLPFPVGTVLNREQIKVLRKYNRHDVLATTRFYHETIKMIRFREELSRKHNRDFLNHNDTKIGKDFFIMQLEKAGIQCYTYGADGRQPRQTPRPQIQLGEAILPWIQFDNPELQRVLDWLRDQTITETKGVFKDLTAQVDGFEFVFGLGGIHGSVDNQSFESTADMVIIDIDVESYYPSTAIAQRFKPAHYPDTFCDIYADLKEQRKQHAKGTAENAILKLALNGVFGDSNNRYSVFYDPLMTMQITLNGQLLLCLLAEKLMVIEGLQMVQANTDGLTVYLPRKHLDYFRSLVSWWEGITGLVMEEAEYSRMLVRDVNNYIAEYASGKVKRKGAYEYDLGWHQNASALVVPKVAELALLKGWGIRETVTGWPNMMDFMLRAKIPRSSRLVITYPNDSENEYPLQNLTRYYVSKEGGTMVKIMPPLPKNPDKWRRFEQQKGWKVQPCNDIKDATAPIDYEYYIREVEKLVLGMQ